MSQELLTQERVLFPALWIGLSMSGTREESKVIEMSVLGSRGAGEMAQLRVLAALKENLGSIPSTQLAAHHCM